MVQKSELASVFVGWIGGPALNKKSAVPRDTPLCSSKRGVFDRIDSNRDEVLDKTHRDGSELRLADRSR